MLKKWKISQSNNEIAAKLAEKHGFDPFFSLLLVARGYDTKEKIDAFLSEGIELSDPLLISDMDKAVERINLALESGEKICVYGDYDADGVTATAVVYLFLESQGANVVYSVPQREDGYGMNKESLKSLEKQGVSLVITVDNGISAIEEAEFATEIGIDLIITDHHQIGKELPKAIAVINPHKDQLPFCQWAGVGVAFKLICALYDGDIQDLIDDYGDLVAIGTVADMVPLVNENRALVKAGLNVINGSHRPGLVAFRQVANMQDKTFSSTDLAYLITPKINAAGRMNDAAVAVQFLVEENLDNAVILAQQLFEMNSARQAEEQKIFDQISENILQNGGAENDRVIVVYGEGYNSGIIGIVASKLVNAFGKPAIVLTNDENGVAKGSCRSVSGFSIYDAISACDKDLIKFGGHPQAAGLSLNIENIKIFAKHINEYAYSCVDVMPVPEITIDCFISPGYLTLDLLDNISKLGPFGINNEHPVFAITGAEIVKTAWVGDGKHLRLSCKKGKLDFTAMCFGMIEKDFLFDVGCKVDLAIKISLNVFKGVESVSIQVVDIRPCKFQHSKFAAEKELWLRFKNGENIPDESVVDFFPTREISAKVYRFLLKQNGYNKDVDGLYFALGLENVTYPQIMISLKAFRQLKLIDVDNDKIELIAQNGKVDLDNAPILIELKSRMNYGQ